MYSLYNYYMERLGILRKLVEKAYKDKKVGADEWCDWA